MIGLITALLVETTTVVSLLFGRVVFATTVIAPAMPAALP